MHLHSWASSHFHAPPAHAVSYHPAHYAESYWNSYHSSHYSGGIRWVWVSVKQCHWDAGSTWPYNSRASAYWCPSSTAEYLPPAHAACQNAALKAHYCAVSPSGGYCTAFLRAPCVSAYFVACQSETTRLVWHHCAPVPFELMLAQQNVQQSMAVCASWANVLKCCSCCPFSETILVAVPVDKPDIAPAVRSLANRQQSHNNSEGAEGGEQERGRHRLRERDRHTGYLAKSLSSILRCNVCSRGESGLKRGSCSLST